MSCEMDKKQATAADAIAFSSRITSTKFILMLTESFKIRDTGRAGNPFYHRVRIFQDVGIDLLENKNIFCTTVEQDCAYSSMDKNRRVALKATQNGSERLFACRLTDDLM